MKTFIKFLCFFVLTLCYSCGSEKDPDYEKTANQIMLKTMRELSKKYQLIPSGEGGGMMYDVEMIMLSFKYTKKIQVDEARKLLIECVQHLLKNINESEEIRPYLHNYPFMPKNVEIGLFYLSNNGEPLPPFLAMAIAYKGTCEYTTTKGETYETIHSESYEKALQIVQEEKNKVNR